MPATSEAATPVAPARSRRAVIAGALGGAAALVAGRLASPSGAAAAPGDSIILGSETNNAGNELTQVLSSSGDTSFRIVNSVGTALMGHVQATTGTGRGVYGRVDTPDGDGMQARNGSALSGNGAAIRAYGDKNDAVVATVTNGSYAFHGSGSTNIAIYGSGTQSGVSGVGYRGVVGSTSSGFASAGVYGNNSGNTDTYGVLGLASGTPNARGVFGHASNATGINYGVYGRVDSTSASATGVRGENTSATGAGYGVYGTSPSTSTASAGVRGIASGASGNGVYGSASATTAESVGVWGASASAAGEGVLATNSAGGLAIRADADVLIDGDLEVTGAVAKASGSFKIDHPLEPTKKWLYHSFVESPDMKNVYDGVAELDAKGAATVTLPTYFQALNRDFRYQLTAIGVAAPNLHVSKAMDANSFSIGGGVAGQSVSWQVTGIRQDAWAKAHPIVAEVAKTGKAAGKYMHPTAHGKPASAGVTRAPRV
jgi:hypothetical protein